MLVLATGSSCDRSVRTLRLQSCDVLVSCGHCDQIQKVDRTPDVGGWCVYIPSQVVSHVRQCYLVMLSHGLAAS